MAREDARLRILAADDDPVMRRLFQNYLADDQFELALVSDGESAIETAPLFQPKLVFLDVIMPNMDGLSALATLREMSGFRQTPVIIITSRTDTVTLIQAIENGATDFLSKPFTKEKLKHKIRFLLQPEDERKEIAGLFFIESIEETVENISDLRRKMLLNIEYIYLYLLKLVVMENPAEITPVAWRLLNSISALKLNPLKGKVVQMMAAVKTREWEGAIIYLEEIYIYLKDLARQEQLS
ncbi:MAG: response regulator [Calditrichaeota bacterium]|nr:response regulator [Calditrichota bacterium]